MPRSYSSENYFIRLTGPGVDVSLQISEPEDLALLELFLNKIRRELGEKDVSSLMVED